MVAVGSLRGYPSPQHRSPSSMRRLVILGVGALMVVQALASYINFSATTANQQASSAKSSPASPAPAPTQRAKVEAGSQPGEIVITFPPAQAEQAALAIAEKYELRLISGDAASGRYVFALPRVDIQPETSTTAIVPFPAIMAAAGVSAYLTNNHLRVIHTIRIADAPSLGRNVVVQLPDSRVRLVDAVRGLFAIQLPAALTASELASWARSSGVRVVDYDTSSGSAVLHPLNWRSPAAARPLVVKQPRAIPLPVPA